MNIPLHEGVFSKHGIWRKRYKENTFCFSLWGNIWNANTLKTSIISIDRVQVWLPLPCIQCNHINYFNQLASNRQGHRRLGSCISQRLKLEIHVYFIDLNGGFYAICLRILIPGNICNLVSYMFTRWSIYERIQWKIELTHWTRACLVVKPR